MVFDRLSPNARGLAQKAALSYIDERNGPDNFTGVFLIDLSLNTIQSYTDDQQLVRNAIDQATMRATGTYASSTERVRNLSERSAALEQSAADSASAATQAGSAQDSGAAGAAGAQSGLAAAEQMLAEINARMLESFESLERDQQGYATTNGLHAVVDSLRNLPGRKTMIFFSEGLSIPPNVVRLFRGVISAANRANVAIYTVDAAGLRIESTDAESRREINSLANRRARQAATGRDDASGPLTKSLERNEDLLRLNPHSGLGDLAGETGGLLIANTNDLVTGLKRVDEDMRAHYELAYVPKNTNYDGKFRQVSVKLARSNLDVQTRKGYFALNAQMSSPVLEYEAPAVAALTGGRADNSFSVMAAGFNFPETNLPGLLPVLVEVPAGAFTFSSDKDKNTYNTDFSIVVLIKDRSQQIVRKLSQNYQLTGPLDKIDMAKRSEILFYRETRLPPGSYSIEAVAYDAPSGKAGVKTSSVEVPDASGSQLRLSSVVLVKRGERVSAGQNGNNPFQFGEALLYPNTGEPLRKSTSKQLTFFFTAYTQKGATDKVNLTIEILKGGQSMGQTSGELPASDAEGRIQYANALPLDGFEPGAYELKITVKNSGASASRSTKFTVVP
ncbi:MAG: VWA domain-containing protein [Blastocatellia bacterium]|nr:VWA domain-containing protein [Blastocatellia bacterium]